jgi:glycosyltransferase involved in cell wall biosynthesis
VDTALISVIVPVFNGEAFLPAALESVLAQTHRSLEVIVVDDGSDDSSAEVVSAFPGVRCLRQSNQGHAAAKNAGVLAARGQLLAFLDADDLWAPTKLHTQLDYLKAQPEVGAVVCRQRVFAQPGTTLPSWLAERVGRDRFEGTPPAFVPSALLVRRQVFEQVGPFDTSYRHGNDSDWFFRARDAAIRVDVVPEPLLLRRIHGANLSHETTAMQGDLLRVVRTSLLRRRSGHGVAPEAK